ncbi:hypothetical protein U9M48_008776 [Paspalum notatum var. saurae]|uniref:Myb/SANT-like domain-containing protein n=1 Tax=Paspalum notatum var. saurae TaxID=547442 RepID=A0AAQ3SQA9_PASNO
MLGKFYLVDAGYGTKPGFLPLFRGVQYHLNEWGNNPMQNEKELFNLKHSSLRVTVERAFGSLKRRFKILDDATPYFSFTTQVEIVVACCIIHNWIIQDGCDEFIIPEQNWMPTYSHASSSSGQAMEVESSGVKAGQCQWTPTQSQYMLTFLVNIVANGTRTSVGFKRVHLNAGAKALNEHFKLKRNEDHIANHLKTWRRKYNKINQLRNLSAALWDEDNFIISLDHEHYTAHCGHRSVCKGSNEPLGTAGDDIEEIQGEDTGAAVTADDGGATSSATRPNKRAKIVQGNADGLVAAFDRASERLSGAIKEATTADKDMPEGLFDTVNTLPGFEHEHRWARAAAWILFKQALCLHRDATCRITGQTVGGRVLGYLHQSQCFVNITLSNSKVDSETL